MNKGLILSCFTLLVRVAVANHYCRKNAFIRWNVTDSRSDQYGVKVTVAGGQMVEEISNATIAAAFTNCANRKMLCAGAPGRFLVCNHSRARHPAKGATGRGNIEFDCSDGPYTCYDFRWESFS